MGPAGRPLAGLAPLGSIPTVARLLILGGGCRGRQLAAEVVSDGHAARIVTRSEARRGEIEATGAECFIGDPFRLGTLRGALEGVAVACWLFAIATGSAEELRDLHTSRLPAFLGAAVDSTMRAFVYEAPAGGAPHVEDIAARNAIPATALTADPHDVDLWMLTARATLSLYL
jgi:uncharacterized protein YbjT (DUF2867 family)